MLNYQIIIIISQKIKQQIEEIKTLIGKNFYNNTNNKLNQFN